MKTLERWDTVRRLTMEWGAKMGTAPAVDRGQVDRTIEAGSEQVVTTPPNDPAENHASDDGTVDRTEGTARNLGLVVHCGAISEAEREDSEPERPVRRRRTKLDLARAFWIVHLIRCGVSRSDVASRSGVARSTFQSWLARGRSGEPGFKGFVEAIEQAESDHAKLLCTPRRGILH
jgi:hypothetical protein